jgi:hypothetical protein
MTRRVEGMALAVIGVSNVLGPGETLAKDALPRM